MVHVIFKKELHLKANVMKSIVQCKWYAQVVREEVVGIINKHIGFCISLEHKSPVASICLLSTVTFRVHIMFRVLLVDVRQRLAQPVGVESRRGSPGMGGAHAAA